MIDKPLDDCGPECEEHQEATMPQLPDPVELHVTGVAWADGACKGNPGPMGLGVVVELYADGKRSSVRYSGGAINHEDGTNNMAEYIALIEALEIFTAELTPVLMDARTTTVRPDTLTTIDLVVYTDSELVVKQISGEYEAKDKALKQLCLVAQQKLEMMRQYNVTISIKWIPREENDSADKLAQAALNHLLADESLQDRMSHEG
jgi:ribonuclease HI